MVSNSETRTSIIEVYHSGLDVFRQRDGTCSNESVMDGRDSPTSHVASLKVEGVHEEEELVHKNLRLRSNPTCGEDERTATNESDTPDCQKSGQGGEMAAGVMVLSDLLDANFKRSSSTGSSSSGGSKTSPRGQRAPSQQLPVLKESGISIDFLNNPGLADVLDWGSSRSLTKYVQAAAAMDRVTERPEEDATDHDIHTWHVTDEHAMDERLSSAEISAIQRGGGGEGWTEDLSAWCEVRETLDDDPDSAKMLVSRKSSGLDGDIGSLFIPPEESSDSPSSALWSSRSGSPTLSCLGLETPRRCSPASSLFAAMESGSTYVPSSPLSAAAAAYKKTIPSRAKRLGGLSQWKSMSDMCGIDRKVDGLPQVNHEDEGEMLAAAVREAADAAIKSTATSSAFDFVPSSNTFGEMFGSRGGLTSWPVADDEAKRFMVEKMRSSIGSEMTDGSKNMFGIPCANNKGAFTRHGSAQRQRKTTGEGIQPLGVKGKDASFPSSCTETPVFQGYLIYEDLCSMMLILLFLGAGVTWLIL